MTFRLGAKREPGGRIQTDTCRGTKCFSQVAEHRVDPVHYLPVKLQNTYSIDAPRIAFKGISLLKTFCLKFRSNTSYQQNVKIVDLSNACS